VPSKQTTSVLAEWECGIHDGEEAVLPAGALEFVGELVGDSVSVSCRCEFEFSMFGMADGIL
jgi:hypothetical protein